MDFDLNKLLIFYEVVQSDGLSKAQESLGIKVSSISAQLSSLEKTLGTSLLTRSKSGIKLTARGEVLYNYLKESLPSVEKIYEIVGGEEQKLSGVLKISTWIGFGVHFLTDNIGPFIRETPNLEVVLIGDNAEIEFNNYEYDAAIRDFIPNRKDLIQKEFISYPHKLYASKEYVQKYGQPEKVKDLDHHRLITLTEKPYGKFENMDWYLTAGREKGDLRRPSIVMNSTAGVEKLILQGLGIGSLAPFYDSVKTGQLVEILPAYEKPKLTFHYIYPRSMESFEKIKAFERFLFQDLKNKFQL